jgi:hypothetical protein
VNMSGGETSGGKGSFTSQTTETRGHAYKLRKNFR